MTTRKTIRSAGERQAIAEAKALVMWSRDAGVLPLVVQVGDVRLELAPMPPAATKLTPQRDQGRQLLEEYGGEALAELLADKSDELEAAQ